MTTELKIETNYYEDLLDLLKLGANTRLPNVRAEVAKNNLIAYNIQNDFWETLIDVEEYRDELKKSGLILLFDEKKRVMSIEEAENVFAVLTEIFTATSDTANSDTEAAEISTSDTVTSATKVAETAAQESYEYNTAYNTASVEETADEASNEPTEIKNAESAEAVEAVKAVEAVENVKNFENPEIGDRSDVSENANEINDTNEIDEIDETDDKSGYCWDYCIVLLGNSELDARVLYAKAIKAGRYAVNYDIALPEDGDIHGVIHSASTDNATDVVDADKTDDATNVMNISDNLNDDVNEIALFLITNIIWSDAFIPVHQHMLAQAADIIGKTLYINNSAKGVTATGVLQDAGKRILVKAGSTISMEDRLLFQKGQGNTELLRQHLIDNNVIVDRVFTADYEFTSTSTAASVILGRAASGMVEWKDEAGHRLETVLGRR